MKIERSASRGNCEDCAKVRCCDEYKKNEKFLPELAEPCIDYFEEDEGRCVRMPIRKTLLD